MKGQPGPRAAGTWPIRWVAAAAAVVVALFAVVLLSGLPAESRRVLSGIGMTAGGLAVATSMRHRRRPSTGRRRRAWTLFTAAALLAAASNLLLLMFPPRPGRGASVGDACLALALGIGVTGLATFPLARRRGTDLTRMVLDGIIIGGSLLFVASVTVFPQILDTRDSGALVLVVPVIDIVIATLATLLFLRGAPSDRPPLGLAAVGFVCYAVSDFAYAGAVGPDGTFTFGSITDIGWISGYTLLALAVRNRGTPEPAAGESASDEPAVEISPIAGTAVVFTLFLAAAGLNLVKLQQSALTLPSAVLWLFVLLAVLARQLLLIIDNDRLRRILEQQVDERSRSLYQVTQRSDLLVDAVGDGIYGVDHDGLVTFVNPAAARALGFAPPALIGHDAHVFFHAPRPGGEPFPAAECYVTEAIRDGVATNAEEDTYLRSDGLAVPVEVTATPLYEAGRVTGAVVVFRDVTQRREVDRLKSEFVSMVSHELRTPLTAIRGSLGLIGGGAVGQLSPAAARMVEIALISSDRLTRLIDEILDIERIESGVIALDLADHRAEALVDAASGQVQILAEQADVLVQVGSVEGVVHADADRVVQTLLNLVGNAIKFSPAGETVQLRAQPVDAFVEFGVVDHGRGIPEHKLDTIFDRFEQVDSSDAREKGGSGLGLAISRSIVERLGGRIWATNNPGGGATFRFTLPRPTGESERDPAAGPREGVDVREPAR